MTRYIQCIFPRWTVAAVILYLTTRKHWDITDDTFVTIQCSQFLKNIDSHPHPPPPSHPHHPHIPPPTPHVAYPNACRIFILIHTVDECTYILFTTISAHDCPFLFYHNEFLAELCDLFTHILRGCPSSTGAIVKLTPCQLSNPGGYIEGILPKGPYPPCLRMADRAPIGRIPSIYREGKIDPAHVSSSTDIVHKPHKQTNIDWFQTIMIHKKSANSADIFLGMCCIVIGFVSVSVFGTWINTCCCYDMEKFFTLRGEIRRPPVYLLLYVSNADVWILLLLLLLAWKSCWTNVTSLCWIVLLVILLSPCWVEL